MLHNVYFCVFLHGLSSSHSSLQEALSAIGGYTGGSVCTHTCTIINARLHRSSTSLRSSLFVIMPTGGGKVPVYDCCTERDSVHFVSVSEEEPRIETKT